MNQQEKLSAPFAAGVVSFKPQAVKGNRAMAVAYISARDVMNRLDEAVGAGGWADDYTVLPDGCSIMCRLTVTVDGQSVTKSDVGGPSEQPDGGDRIKAAFSDAFKRTAVKFGVGRYLYELPQVWCDFDPVKKQFTQTPQLPAWALPARPAPQAQPRQQQPAAAAPPSFDEMRAGINAGVTDMAEFRKETYASQLRKFLDYFEPNAVCIADIRDDRLAAAFDLIKEGVTKLTKKAGQSPAGR